MTNGTQSETSPVGLSATDYWDERYRQGGTSGAGSRRHLARYKNVFLNHLVLTTGVRSVMELGCGDGMQLKNAIYPTYYGLDVSAEAVAMCSRMYESNRRRSFVTIDQVESLPQVDVSMSLDVIYHILDDEDYRNHLRILFKKSLQYVVIYGNDIVLHYKPKHITLRDFIGDIARDHPEWELVRFERNPFYSEVGRDPTRTWANFHVYRRRPAALDAWRIGRENPRPEAIAQDPPVEALDPQKASSFWPTQPLEAVFRVPRSEDALSSLLPLFRSAHIRDLTGWVEEAGARTEHYYFARAERPRVVVSLTTISSRIEEVHRVIDSVWRGSVVPDEIVLHLSEEPNLLDEGISPGALPKPLRKQEAQGLVRIVWVPNTGPHRKIVDTLREDWMANWIIVTADDDIILARDWLKLLLREHAKTGGVVAFRGRRMTFTDSGSRIGPYRDWPLVDAADVSAGSAGFMPTGKYGVLYPPRCFDERVLSPELIAAAPGADDLFLKACSTLAGVQSHIVRVSAQDQQRYDLRFGKIAATGPSLWDGNKRENDAKLASLIDAIELNGTPRDLLVGLLAGS